MSKAKAGAANHTTSAAALAENGPARKDELIPIIPPWLALMSAFVVTACVVSMALLSLRAVSDELKWRAYSECVREVGAFRTCFRETHVYGTLTDLDARAYAECRAIGIDRSDCWRMKR